MKKPILFLFFGVACIAGATMINNTSVCKMLLQNDVNSYTEPNGGSCNGAPDKCKDGGCWSDYCLLETRIEKDGQWVWTKDATKADEGQFACCWYEYTNTAQVVAIHAASYPLECCNL